MFKVLTECKFCKSTFELSPEMIKKEKVEVKKGKSIWLTYFDCPVCGHVHFVQIDDVRTNKLLSELTKVMASTRKAIKYGHQTKRQSAKYRRINQDLNLIRNDLEKEFEGTNISLKGYDAVFVLELTKFSDSELDIKS